MIVLEEKVWNLNKNLKRRRWKTLSRRGGINSNFWGDLL